MFQRVYDYGLIEADGRLYRARTYGAIEPDGTWGGWLVFFPLDGALAISTDRETTQASFADLRIWAEGLSAVYLDGAVRRALALVEKPPILSELSQAEYAALHDAERFRTAADLHAEAARFDERAASAADADAERLREARLETEGELAATEEQSAKIDAALHEHAAKGARAAAADASRRRRMAKAEARATQPPKRRRSAK
jgi:hypothetical protein